MQRQPKTLLIADDHPLVLEGMMGFIETDPNLMVVAICRTGDEVLSQLEATRPDLALLDFRMPGFPTLDVLTQARDRGLPTRMVLISAGYTDVEIRLATENSAWALLHKDCAPQSLLDCLHAAGLGIPWDSGPNISSALARESARLHRSGKLLAGVTPREREVLQHLATGASNKEIARTLGISDGTVKIHMHNLYAKMGTTNRADLMKLAAQVTWDESI